jgi:DNA-binding MurR/RpiR family transcriptional regulator
MPIRKDEVNPLDSGDLIELLRRHYDQFTESQKRIAKYIIEHSQAVAFSTVDKMAAELDMNPSTIVRFTYRLGLDGYPDLQGRIRALVRGQLSRMGSPANESQVARRLQGTSFGASLSHDWENLGRTIAGIDVDCVERAVKFIANDRRIYVAAGFSSFPVALYFAQVLERLRGGISLLASNDTLAAARLVNMKPEDCLLGFSFPPYARETYRIALWAKENRAKVVAVTDSPISAVGQLADVLLVVPSAGIGVQNSMVAPMAVANALLNGVAASKGTSALERYSRHDRMMNRWDAFLLKVGDEDT